MISPNYHTQNGMAPKQHTLPIMNNYHLGRTNNNNTYSPHTHINHVNNRNPIDTQSYRPPSTSIPLTHNTSDPIIPAQHLIYPSTIRHNNIARPQHINTRPHTPANLPPKTRVEYVPYEQRYVQYVQQRVRVPVQKVKMDYYPIQHIVDYVPIAKEQVVYVTQPHQAVDMRVQYVPVEQRIIHINEQDANRIGLNKNNYLPANYQNYQNYQAQHLPVTLYQTEKINTQPNQEKPIDIRKSRTNYVTSEGYDPNQRIREIDRVLAESEVRQRMDQQYYQQRANQQQSAQKQYNQQSSINLLDSIVGGVGNMMKKDTKITNSGVSQRNNPNNSKLKNGPYPEQHRQEGEEIIRSLGGALGGFMKKQSTKQKQGEEVLQILGGVMGNFILKQENSQHPFGN